MRIYTHRFGHRTTLTIKEAYAVYEVITQAYFRFVTGRTNYYDLAQTNNTKLGPVLALGPCQDPCGHDVQAILSSCSITMSTI